VTLGTPINTTGLGPIGIVFNWQGTTATQTTMGDINGLTSLLSSSVGPAVGTNPLTSGGSQFYYRSPAGEFTGNFTGSSGRTIAVNTNVLTRIWAVPTPGSAALLGLGGLLAARRRR
jgi:hypothetical protein